MFSKQALNFEIQGAEILYNKCLRLPLSLQESELDRRRDNEVPGDLTRGAHYARLDGAEEQAGG